MAVGGEGRSPGVCGITREAEPDGAGLRASSSLLDRVVWDNFFSGGAGEGWGNRAEAHKASTNNICRVGEKSLERKMFGLGILFSHWLAILEPKVMP